MNQGEAPSEPITHRLQDPDSQREECKEPEFVDISSGDEFQEAEQAVSKAKKPRKTKKIQNKPTPTIIPGAPLFFLFTLPIKIGTCTSFEGIPLYLLLINNKIFTIKHRN